MLKAEPGEGIADQSVGLDGFMANLAEAVGSRLHAGEGGINLIPIDYFTAAFLALMEGAPGGGIFHVVNGRAKRIEDIIDYSRRHFRLTGVRACTPDESKGNPQNPLESLYDHYVEAYGPYMRDTRVFETARSRPILEARGIVCPEFDYEIFARCMDYAVETGWGSRLFPVISDRAERGSRADRGKVNP
jgi:hypothetical protein